MLSAEEASARLASLRDPDWRMKAADRARKLRRKLREPAEALLAPRPAYHVPGAYQGYRDRQVAAARQLDEMPDSRRASVMDVLHPGLGAALARWWIDAQGRPYQRGWDRKAFRAAGSPQLTVEARGTDLAALADLAGPFEADPVWLAGWGGHLAMAGTPASRASGAIGSVLASAIDLGGRPGEETLTTLIEVGNGEHPVGVMGRHVIAGLLGSSRPEGWEFIVRLLLAAQRQEGLRQAILEAADEGHPEAFDRILAIVLDHKLLRFAAAVRAAGVWLGFGAQVAELAEAEDRVRRLAAFRADPDARGRALRSGDPWDAYVALCARGMRDVLATIPEAEALTRHSAPDIRAAALSYAAATGLTAGQRLVVTALDDADVRVASLAVALLGWGGQATHAAFDPLTRLIPRLPAKPRGAPVGIQQAPVPVSRSIAAGHLVDARGHRDVGVLLPWLPSMDATGRLRVAAAIGRERRLTGELRQVLVELLGDRSSAVRQQALRALSATRLDRSAAPAVEALLTRGAADLRRGALTLLASLPAGAARASADRLAASSDARQREAATELRQSIGAAAGPAGPAPVEDLGATLADVRGRTT
ncbi:MAG: HEAT repeat domain-containing protein, partial [Actinobacteria bacterium]|nr:HEAT repeat domain-containing protein [Actinomycetota bacterium]